MSHRLNRRDFMKQGGAGLGAALGVLVAGAAGEPQRRIKTGPIDHLATPPLETIRVGFVGVGMQGG
ncbi:MAG: twin-arginine translocation signal domain-containing protein, partial [Candidatus Aminicenantes bacterium]|nr:twin-arginine translocation signal domain-containing protein [Candidatus Aminicenantes bacterium]